MFGDDNRRITLRKVHYVANSSNILSVKQLINEQFAMNFTPKELEIVKPNGKTFCTAVTEPNSRCWSIVLNKTKVKLRKKPIMPSNDYYKLHYKLGHPSFCIMREFAKRYLNKSIKKGKYCEYCCKGASNKSGKKSSHSFENEPSRRL